MSMLRMICLGLVALGAIYCNPMHFLFTEPAGVQTSSPASAEPPAPSPTKSVQILLDDAGQLLQTGKTEDALASSEQALSLAQKTEDEAGQARAWQHKGQIFTRLQKIEEAIASYRKAAAVWKSIEFAPGQIETLGTAGLLLCRNNPEDGGVLLNQAISLTQSEKRRPVAAASALNNVAELGWEVGLFQQSQSLAEAVLPLLQSLVPNSKDVARTYTTLGLVMWNLGHLSSSEDYHKKALAICESLGEVLAIAKCLNNLGLVKRDQSKLEDAKDYYERALALYKTSGNELSTANCLNNLGIVVRNQGNLTLAEDYYNQALTIQEKSGRDPLATARSLTNLGNVAADRSDLSAAESYLKRALDIKQKFAPNTSVVTVAYINLCVVMIKRGDLSSAKEYCEKALAISAKQATSLLQKALILGNLSNIAFDQGNLFDAEKFGRAELEITRPDTIEMVTCLNNLGLVAHERGDLALAEEYYKKAKVVCDKLPSALPRMALVLGSLGNVEMDHGNYALAEKYIRDQLAIVPSGSLEKAIGLNNLGCLAHVQGDLASAEGYFKQAKELCQKQASLSVPMALELHNLGHLAMQRDNLASAEDYANQALTIRDKLAPRSLDTSNTLLLLSQIYLRQNHRDKALSFGERAADIVEEQRTTIKSLEARTLLSEKFGDAFTALLLCQLTAQKPEDAFHTLERARARSFVERLQERILEPQASTPKELLLAKEQLDNDRSIAYATLQRTAMRLQEMEPQQKAGALSANDQKLFDKFTTENREVRQLIEGLAARQRELDARFRQVDTRYAHVFYPHPIELKQAQAQLEPGTLALLFYVAEQETLLFTVTRTEFHIYHLPLSEKQLHERVQSFRSSLLPLDKSGKMVTNPATFRSYLKTNYQKQGKLLYKSLFGEALPQIKKAKRLLISPDGPLHALPFAALVTEQEKGKAGTDRPRFLIEEKPLYFISSLTAYQQLHDPRLMSKVRKGPNDPGYRVLAVGNPSYAQSVPLTGKPAEVASRTLTHHQLLMGGRDRQELALTQQQVNLLQSLYKGKDIVPLQGTAATPSQVLQQGSGRDLLHFGCHGLAEDTDPLGSSLALTPEGKDKDGLLYAWQVMQYLRLPGSLVVLGACDTAVGPRTRSEGLEGLARAFQYAGARGVVASLWSVETGATNALLQSFHRSVQSGKSTEGVAGSLQKSQQEMLRQDSYAHPFFWAAFQLFGDWK